jgi:hypothetical protein
MRNTPITPITLVMPEPDLPEADIGDKPITPLFMYPEGKVEGRETPGFFIIQLDGKPILPVEPVPGIPDGMPKTFLSLNAVHEYLRVTYGWTIPLRVTTFLRIEQRGKKDFPAVWGARRRLSDGVSVIVRVRYLGSFLYWDGRRVDPTVVGTSREFN